ncbi:leucyl/phenylalanyl-tRNA--protein transferase [Thioclava atlantica]|uniref:Leucyl/phenylalanyl-tRNA--protein transferase n=1 Tax=Thioclava atlantica TaxID=1317124 RepID=A0A085TYQ2_9RHOB|nr:leucyl/phenylalanyl-tRNA--protein transferase [Thioclava atlantica]KFE35849.1 leucyl/phenylalanyl-tRNA--protein transferase [Thioclava atlantica]
MTDRLSARLLLAGYAQGIFPMAESRENPELHWFDPARRGIVPLENFHISRSLAKNIRRGNYSISIDRDFRGVVEGCADRDETWINGPLFDLYDELHAAGFAHSLEVWQDGALAGGIFGITLGGAFFGESMFSRRTDASKTALAYLVDRLRQGGFSLFDTQYITPHLARMGAIEIPRLEYRARLAQALHERGDFAAPETPDPQSLLQRMAQTS